MNDAQYLCQQVITLLKNEPAISELTAVSIADCDNLSRLFSAVLTGVVNGNKSIGKLTGDIFSAHRKIQEYALRDILETARRNFEPAGPAASLLFSRGIHATLAHRVAHQLWLDGQHNLALAYKTTLGRLLSTDIHPAAHIGSGFWLDHGLGLVVGETALIEEDVSIWHNVTLGSTLTDSSPTRHPTIRQGAVIGAGAQVLGNIEIGHNATVAAGAIVLNNIPAGKVAVGSKAKILGNSSVSFTP